MNSRSTIGGSTSYNGYTTHRPAVLGLVKVLLLGLSQIPYASAAPLYSFVGLARREDAPRDAEDPSLWLYLAIAAVLVSNVIVNETLPIVLDRSLGGGWPAVLGSTVLIGMALHYRTT
jgi:hypothetical protein